MLSDFGQFLSPRRHPSRLQEPVSGEPFQADPKRRRAYPEWEDPLEVSTLDVEWVAPDQLRLNPANPRRNEAAVPHVAASLARFGWRQPIVARPSGELVAGHTRLLAARSLGMKSVPVVRFEGSDLEATAYAIADNRTHEFAEWDQAGLAQLLGELRSEDALEGVGFTGSEIDELLAELAAEAAAATELDDPGPEEACACRKHNADASEPFLGLLRRQ